MTKCQVGCHLLGDWSIIIHVIITVQHMLCVWPMRMLYTTCKEEMKRRVEFGKCEHQGGIGSQTSGDVAEGKCPSFNLFSTLSSTTLNVFLCLEGGMFSLSSGHHMYHSICLNWHCITSFWDYLIETQSLPLHLVLSMADFLLQWQTGVVVTENSQPIKPQIFAMPPFFQKKLANFCSRSYSFQEIEWM